MLVNYKGIKVLLLSVMVCLLFPKIATANTLPSIKTPVFMTLGEIQGGIDLGGLIVKSYYFSSSKGNEDIVHFYNKLWDDKLKTVETDKWFYHSYFDGEYLYTIQVRNNETDTFGQIREVNGVIGISEPATIKEQKTDVKKELFYPIVPGTKTLTDLSSVDLGKNSRTTVYDAAGGVIQNLNHYKLHFENKGWKEILNKMSLGMAKELGGTSLIMQNGSSELVISFIPDDKGRTKIVSVLVEED